VHGWIYGLQDGLLRDLDTTVTQPEEVATSYRDALAKLKLSVAPHPNSNTAATSTGIFAGAIAWH